MLEALNDPDKRAVGTKQVIRAVEGGQAACVFLANDADAHIRQKIIVACRAAGVPVEEVRGMQELGKACRIQVGAAAACLLF
jgi:large subunit ribosomal protein L7A